MISITELARLTKITPRTLRFYEEKGLVTSLQRGLNGFRFFSSKTILRVEEIKKLKKMKFSLDEIKSILVLKEDKLDILLYEKLQRQLVALDFEIVKLVDSKKEVQKQLLITQKFINGLILEKNQRKVLMETVNKEILDHLSLKRQVQKKDIEYLKREKFLYDTKDKREFFNAIGRCLDFAKIEGIKLGPTRGAAPACLSFYAIGWSIFDPTKYNLFPERFSSQNLELHIDVEFKNGKKFIDFCKKESSALKIGQIEAFKLPIIDIIENVHNSLGNTLEIDSISDDDPLVLDIFRNGDIEKIFSFDIPANSLLSKHFDGYYSIPKKALQGFRKFLKSQEIHSFVDLINIEAVYRPSNKNTFMNEFIQRYPRAKKDGFSYDCLTPALNDYLKPNYGVIIYQEDIMKIIHEYTSWSLEKCNDFRLKIVRSLLTQEEKYDFLKFADSKVLDLLLRETPITFCKAHSFGAWPKLIKTTSVFKTLHRKLYFNEIEKWEKENNYSWGDFGFIKNGVSLMQQ